MESFGDLIRKLRTKRGLLLREVAAKIDVDPSFLSRIECNNKRATRKQVIELAAALNADENELLITYLSDNVVYELQGEKLALRAMSVAEQKIRYLLRSGDSQ